MVNIKALMRRYLYSRGDYYIGTSIRPRLWSARFTQLIGGRTWSLALVTKIKAGK